MGEIASNSGRIRILLCLFLCMLMVSYLDYDCTALFQDLRKLMIHIAWGTNFVWPCDHLWTLWACRRAVSLTINFFSFNLPRHIKTPTKIYIHKKWEEEKKKIEEARTLEV